MPHESVEQKLKNQSAVIFLPHSSHLCRVDSERTGLTIFPIVIFPLGGDLPMKLNPENLPYWVSGLNLPWSNPSKFPSLRRGNLLLLFTFPVLSYINQNHAA